jgi:hypothetical protein
MAIAAAGYALRILTALGLMASCGLLASPLYVLAALHRMAYVRAIAEGPAPPP